MENGESAIVPCVNGLQAQHIPHQLVSAIYTHTLVKRDSYRYHIYSAKFNN